MPKGIQAGLNLTASGINRPGRAEFGHQRSFFLSSPRKPGWRPWYNPSVLEDTKTGNPVVDLAANANGQWFLG